MPARRWGRPAAGLLPSLWPISPLPARRITIPPKMAQFSEDNGFLDDGLTTWTFMTEGAQKLGLKSKELPADAAQVARAVGEGHPVILTLGPGDFTSTGHFVVVAAIDSDGNLVIRDPNSPERSSRSWDPQRVLGQCRNLWEISPGGWF